jgi:DNA-binding IclR family transcriptional regulator
MTSTRKANPATAARRNNGVQSVEQGFAVLQPLIDANRALPLSMIAESARMPAAKAHRYLVSLIRVRMVVQEATGRYDLGPLAVQLGLASLSRFDPVRYAMADLEHLRDRIDETVSVIVWGVNGPTVLRTDNSMHEVSLTMRAGTVLPVATSASGMLFLAYLPEETAKLTLTTDGRTNGFASEKKRAAIVSSVRRRRLARTLGGVLSGVNALAAPVFAEDGRIAAVVTAYGRSASFDASWNGRVATLLTEFTTQLSSIRRPIV